MRGGRDDVPVQVLHLAGGGWRQVTAELEVRNQTLGGCLIVRVAGELDLATAPVLRDHVLGQLALGKTNLVIDLGRVPFLDSTGVSALVVAHREADARGGSVRLAGARRSVRRVFEITRLDRLFELHDDVSDALEAAMGPTGAGTAERGEPTTSAAP